MKKLLYILLFFTAVTVTAQVKKMKGIILDELTTIELNDLRSGLQVPASIYYDATLKAFVTWDAVAGDWVVIGGSGIGSGSYLPLDGSEDMEGDLDVGFFNIENISEILGYSTYGSSVTSGIRGFSVFQFSEHEGSGSGSGIATNYNNNGSIYYDSSNDRLMVKSNGVWKYLLMDGDSGGGGTDDQNAAEVSYTNNSQTDVEGALDVLFGSISQDDIFTPDMYGATEGSGDSYTALASWINDAASTGKVLHIPYGSKYYSSQALPTVTDKVVDIRGTLIYTGSTFANTTFLEIELTDGEYYDQDHVINVESQTVMYTGNEDFIGVQIGNDSYGSYTIEAKGFEVGAYVLSDGGGVVNNGFQMNSVNIGRIQNCRIGILTEVINTGWSNGNIYQGVNGGGFFQNSNIFRSMDVYGIKFGAGDGSYRLNNANIIRDLDVELNNPDKDPGVETIGILIEGAQGTNAYNLRYERSGDIGMRVTSHIEGGVEQNRQNKLTSTYETVYVDDQTRAKDNYYDRFDDNKPFLNPLVNFAVSTDVHEDGGVFTLSPEFKFQSNFSDVRAQTATGHTLQNDGILLNGSAITVKIKTDLAKKFLVNTVKSGGRLSIKCFDASGNEISGTSGQTSVEDVAVAKGTATFSTLFGGSFRETSGDGLKNQVVTVGDNVAYATFIFGHGSNNTELHGFDIQSYNEPAYVVDGSFEGNTGGGSTNYGLRKTVAKTANFTLSTEDARISSGGDIYRKPRITVNDGNSYTATLGNIGAVDDYFFFAVDNSGSELIVEPSSVDISLNGTTVTGNIKLSNDGEGFLYKTAASKFKAKGEWQLDTGVQVNYFPTGNSASPDADESNSTTGWTATQATVSSSTDANNGTWSIEVTSTNNDGNDRAEITITGLDASKTYTLTYDAKSDGSDSFVQVQASYLDGSQYLQAIGSEFATYSTTLEPSGTSFVLRANACLQNGVGAIGDKLKIDNVKVTENE